jgi:hypothetical protein
VARKHAIPLVGVCCCCCCCSSTKDNLCATDFLPVPIGAPKKNRPYHRLYLSIPSVSMNATSSRTSSSNSLTQHDEEKKDDSTTPEAIAKRLRDKIRLQAESLLSRCESADRSRQSSRNASCQASRDSSPRGGNNSRHNEAVESSSTFQTPLPDGPNTDPASSVATPRTLTADHWPDTNGNNSTPPTRCVSNNSVSNNPDSLTKRLQQLALQRQSIDSNRDRLRVIQSDASSHLSSKCTSFADLPHLPPHLLQALYQMGFDRPSAIQEEALPRILQGRHVIGQAQSGSGKVRNTNHIQRHACTLLAKIASGKVLEILPTHSMTCSLGSWSRDRRRPLRLACCIAWTLP